MLISLDASTGLPILCGEWQQQALRPRSANSYLVAEREETMRRAIAVSCLCIFLSLPAASQVQCGGTERWRPKVGTDPEVGQVMVDQPTLIDLNDLIQLPEPVRPNDN